MEAEDSEMKDVLETLGKLLAAIEETRVSDAFMAHPNADPVLSLDQAASYTGLCGKTLKSDALAGKLASLQRKENGRVRFRLSDLNIYLESQRRPVRDFIKSKEIDWSL